MATNPYARAAAEVARIATETVELVRDVSRSDGMLARRVTGHLGGKGGDGPPVSLSFVGREAYFKDFLLFFGDKTGRRLTEQVTLFEGPLWSLLRARSALQAELAQSDIQVHERIGYEARGASDADFFPYLRARLPVFETLDEQLANIRSKSHAQKLRKIQRTPLTFRVTKTSADFDRFYDEMYVPHAQARFGAMSFIEPRESMRETLRERGVLLFVEEGGVAVAGAMLLRVPREVGTLLYFRNGIVGSSTLEPHVMGERNAAMDYFVMQHAIESRMKIIDYDLTSAAISDGVFTHKRRIGCDFQPAPYSPRFTIEMKQATRPRILARYPLVVERQGKLEAWLGYHPEDAPKKLSEWDALVRGYIFPSCRRVAVHMTQAPKEGRAALLQVLTTTTEDTAARVTLEDTNADPPAANPPPTRGASTISTTSTTSTTTSTTGSAQKRPEPVSTPAGTSTQTPGARDAASAEQTGG